MVEGGAGRENRVMEEGGLVVVVVVVVGRGKGGWREDVSPTNSAVNVV